MGEGGVKGGGHIGGLGGSCGRDGGGGIGGPLGHLAGLGGLSLGHSHFLNDKKSQTLKLIQS